MLNGMFGKWQKRVFIKENDKEIRNLVNKKYLELYLKDTINELRLLETNRKARKNIKPIMPRKC